MGRNILFWSRLLWADNIIIYMYLLGVKIDNLGMLDILCRIEEFLKDGKQHQIVTPNPEFIVLAQKDEEFKKILNEASLSIPDGTGIVFASRFLGQGMKEKVSGADLMEKLLTNNKQQTTNNPKIFLLGGKNGAARKISEKFSNIAGFTENIDNAVNSINESQANILFVALGAPKQEKWIHYNIAKIPSVKVAIGVGGAFDFLSGKVPRAPKFLQKIGLEWLWRFILQPWRIKRIYNAVVKFPWLVIKTRITH